MVGKGWIQLVVVLEVEMGWGCTLSALPLYRGNVLFRRCLVA